MPSAVSLAVTEGADRVFDCADEGLPRVVGDPCRRTKAEPDAEQFLLIAELVHRGYAHDRSTQMHQAVPMLFDSGNVNVGLAHRRDCGWHLGAARHEQVTLLEVLRPRAKIKAKQTGQCHRKVCVAVSVHRQLAGLKSNAISCSCKTSASRSPRPWPRAGWQTFCRTAGRPLVQLCRVGCHVASALGGRLGRARQPET